MDFTCEQAARAVLGIPAKRAGAELLWICPNHDDQHPSLSVNAKKDLWMCGPCGASGSAWALAAFLAGCDPGDRAAIKAWLKAHGLLNGAKRTSNATGRGPCVAEYLYPDAATGEMTLLKRRYEPGADGRRKDFAWLHRAGNKWTDGFGGHKPGLYRWPDVQCSPDMILTEGEKDADAGGRVGLPTATTGGVNSFCEDHADMLGGRAVVIVADADEPGRVHAQKVASMLYGKAACVKVVEIPGAKDLAEAIERGWTRERFVEYFAETPEWGPATGAELICRFEGIFKQYIVAPKGVPLVSALYAFMTHCFEVFSWIAYLSFFSPLESCGKSHAADIVGWASARPEILVSITEAALFRLITEQKPTVVVDEAEVLSGDGETAIALRAVLHAGCAPDDGIIRCAPNTHKLEKFSPWCPKIFCAIDKLPRVLASRCIVVNMKRKKADEKVNAFIRGRVKAEVAKVGAEIAAWASAHETEIRRTYESLPDESFDDRGHENFAPLEAILTVADPSRLPEFRQTRSNFTMGSNADMAEDSTGVRLLWDIKGIFNEKEAVELPSAEVAEALMKIETSPWGERLRDKKGNPSTAKLASLLRTFGIRPDRIGGKVSQVRGYALSWFQDAFDRYLPSEVVNPSTGRENGGDGEDFRPSTENPVDTSENVILSNKSAVGGRVDTFRATAVKHN